IEAIQEGQLVQIRAVVVQMYAPKFFYVCPECGKKAQLTADGQECQEHGKIKAEERALLNLVLDDGTGVIRAVLFSDQLVKLVKQEELKNPETASKFRQDLLGTELLIKGMVRRNKLFNNLEINVNDVSKVNVEELVKQLEG
ncbi:MAG: hypothetical protein ACP5D2_05115, partial [Candidatus Nanoarchaeia archaeon]